MFQVSVQSQEGTVLGSFELRTPASPPERALPARLLVGRADDCDLRIRHVAISRHHCAIDRDDEGDWVVRDLGSTAGTIVGSERIAEAAVHDGLVVHIGPAVLRFQAVPVTTMSRR